MEWNEHEVKWSEVAQSCPTLCDPMDYSPPGFSVHQIFQARILEWVAISFSRGSSQPRDWTQVSHIAGRCFNPLSHQGMSLHSGDSTVLTRIYPLGNLGYISLWASVSLVAQRVKCLPAMRENCVWSLGWEDPLEKEMATHSSILAWKIPWMEKSGRLQSWGCKKWARLSDFTFTHFTYNTYLTR